MLFRTTMTGCALLGLLVGTSCDKKHPHEVTPPSSPELSALALVEGGTAQGIPFNVVSGEGGFLIDAPLEKIKGASEEVDGRLNVVTDNLTNTRGLVRVRVSALKTTTFDDPTKNETQTGHARNWMEVGEQSAAETKARFEYATFTIISIETPIMNVAAIPEDPTKSRSVKIQATGDLVLHGVSVQKTALLTVIFRGPAAAPDEMTVKTEEPFGVSLRGHDIKPRDTIGKFLNGALEKVGKKIDDNVQVSIAFTAKRA